MKFLVSCETKILNAAQGRRRMLPTRGGKINVVKKYIFCPKQFEITKITGIAISNCDFFLSL